MSWKITIPPATEPVSIVDMKTHLRVDDTTDDVLIASMIKAARLWCENYQRRAFVEQTLEYKVDYGWPAKFELPRPPLLSVTSIAYNDSSGNSQTLATNQYTVDTTSEPGRIVPAYDITWPATYGYIADITVTYKAGFGATESDVPENIVAAIKLLVGHLYEHREAVAEVNLKRAPMAVESLLMQQRVFV